MKLFYKLVIMFVAIVAMNMWQASSANAAECKGVSRAACKSSASCYWVKGFSRKDGVTVKSHCRSKAKGKHAKRREAIKKKSRKEKSKN